MTELFFENDCARFSRMYDFWDEYPLEVESDKPITVLCSSPSQVYSRDVAAAFYVCPVLNIAAMRDIAWQLIAELGIPDEGLAISCIAYKVKNLASEADVMAEAILRCGSDSEEHRLWIAMSRVLAELKETR